MLQENELKKLSMEGLYNLATSYITKAYKALARVNIEIKKLKGGE